MHKAHNNQTTNKYRIDWWEEASYISTKWKKVHLLLTLKCFLTKYFFPFPIFIKAFHLRGENFYSNHKNYNCAVYNTKQNKNKTNPDCFLPFPLAMVYDSNRAVHTARNSSSHIQAAQEPLDRDEHSSCWILTSSFSLLEAQQTGKRPVVNTQGNSLCSFGVGWARDKVSQADKSIS